MGLSITSNDKIARLFDYWSELRHGNGLPSMMDFDPLSVPDLLPSIWLAGWSDDADDFVYRIAGESILNTHQRAMHKRALREIYGAPMSAYLRERFRRICTEPCIYHARGTVYLRIDRFGAGERLVLPMVDRDSTTPLILGCTVYEFLSSRSELPSDLSDGKSEIRTFLTLDGDVISTERVETQSDFV